MSSKSSLRTDFLSRRGHLTRNEVLKKSEKICNNLLSHKIYRESNNIGSYSPIKKEVETRNIHSASTRERKRVGYPISITGAKKLLYYCVSDLDELHAGVYGILEPPEIDENLLPVEELNIVIIPGIAFDTSGYRLGYGGGYYDRLLSEQVFRAITVALAFEIQIVDTLPYEPHDTRVNLVITENRTIVCS